MISTPASMLLQVNLLMPNLNSPLASKLKITVSDNRDAITTLNTSFTFPPSSASRPSNGFGSRPGGSGCFKCHKEWHMARDCPEAGDSGRGGGGS